MLPGGCDISKGLTRKAGSERWERHGPSQPLRNVAREKAGLMTLTLLKSGEDKRAILNQCPTDRAAILGARERWLADGREWVARLKALVAQKAEEVAAPVVRAALGHHVHDSAR